MDSISQLENASIFILREAYHSFKHLGLLWSIGKDSSVLLWLCRKAFFGHVPMPVMHVDTSFKIPEMIRYRDQMALEWNLDLRYGINLQALEAKQTFPNGQVDRITCCKLLKTAPLTGLLNGKGIRYRLNHHLKKFEPYTTVERFDAVIVGMRADEEGSRSKERYFSPRDESNTWAVDHQPPEFWNYFNSDFPPETHVRVHPLLDWTEANIWEYIHRERIPTVSLYYDQGDGRRYRSLGCANCTLPIESTASNPEEIVVELTTGKLARIAERAGRAQDKEGGGGLEALRKDGYM